MKERWAWGEEEVLGVDLSYTARKRLISLLDKAYFVLIGLAFPSLARLGEGGDTLGALLVQYPCELALCVLGGWGAARLTRRQWGICTLCLAVPMAGKALLGWSLPLDLPLNLALALLGVLLGNQLYQWYQRKKSN